ncbi:hypothetical protein Taro_035287 [Colocasia esculenta]|uniref:Uncharacterized protein n=1 Tax=Colocasia esculenta TaxID=4460 RepID=A0A843WA37_COLES|nr:hypothetical protein [Colocasia esculenta]
MFHLTNRYTIKSLCNLSNRDERARVRDSRAEGKTVVRTAALSRLQSSLGESSQQRQGEHRAEEMGRRVL